MTFKEFESDYREFAYNLWKNSGDNARREMAHQTFLEMMSKIVKETNLKDKERILEYIKNELSSIEEEEG